MDNTARVIEQNSDAYLQHRRLVKRSMTESITESITQSMTRPITRFVILCSVILFLVLIRVFGLIWFHVEDMQFFLFPVVLATYVVLSRLLVPYLAPVRGYAICLVLVIWLFSGLHVRGQLDFLGQYNGVIITRLEGDADYQVARDYANKVNEVSAVYKLQKMTMLQRSFPDLAHVAGWLSYNENVDLLLSGSLSWAHVNLNPPINSSLNPSLNLPSNVALQNDQEEPQKSAELSLDDVAIRQAESDAEAGITDTDKPYVLEVEFGSGDLEMLIVSTPTVIDFPLEPLNLTRHFVAFLSEGLFHYRRVFSTPRAQLPDRFEFGEARFSEALGIHGEWKSPMPKGLSAFLLGNLMLFRHVLIAQEVGDLDCSIFSYRLAAAHAIPTAERELAAALYNNAAISLLMRAYTNPPEGKFDEWLGKVREWLQISIGVRGGGDGRPHLGSRVALSNYIRLKKAGLI